MREQPPTIVIKQVKQAGPCSSCCGVGCLLFVVLGLLGSALQGLGLI